MPYKCLMWISCRSRLNWLQLKYKDNVKIWHLKIPAKVCIFAWRAFLNALPTKVNLSKRGIDISSICPMCDNEVKTIAHSLVFCDNARQVWNLPRPWNFFRGGLGHLVQQEPKSLWEYWPLPCTGLELCQETYSWFQRSKFSLLSKPAASVFRVESPTSRRVQNKCRWSYISWWQIV